MKKTGDGPPKHGCDARRGFAISRRNFLKSTTGALSLGLLGNMTFGLRRALAAPAPPDASRVVVVHDPQVWLGGDTTNAQIDAARANNMIAAGLKRLTGSDNVIGAMQALIPPQPPYSSAKVAIKVNHLSGRLATNYAVVRPICDALTTLGVQSSNITVYDTCGPAGCAGPFSGNLNYEQYNHNTSDDAHWGGSDRISGSTVRWPLALYDADWLINAAVFKDHSSPGVSLCCKNHLGSVNKAAAGYPCGGESLAPLNAHRQLSPHWIPAMGGKCVLYVVDAVYGSIKGNGPGNSVDCTPQRIYFSGDPINIDNVGWDDMDHIHGVPHLKPPHLDLGISLGLGVADLARVVRVEIGEATTRLDVDRKIWDYKAGDATEAEIKELIKTYRGP